MHFSAGTTLVQDPELLSSNLKKADAETRLWLLTLLPLSPPFLWGWLQAEKESVIFSTLWPYLRGSVKMVVEEGSVWVWKDERGDVAGSVRILIPFREFDSYENVWFWIDFENENAVQLYRQYVVFKSKRIFWGLILHPLHNKVLIPSQQVSYKKNAFSQRTLASWFFLLVRLSCFLYSLLCSAQTLEPQRLNIPGFEGFDDSWAHPSFYTFFWVLRACIPFLFLENRQ